MRNSGWWNGSNPLNWTKADLVDLAAQGKDVWNNQIDRWYIAQRQEKDFSDRIDFRGVTFSHDFDEFVFPCCVDFSSATLKNPSFLAARFDGSDIRKTNPDKYLKSPGYFGHCSAWFLDTVFEGAVDLSSLIRKVKFRFHFDGASFKGREFHIAARIQEPASGEIILTFKKVKELVPGGTARISCHAGNVGIIFEDCELNNTELRVAAECRKLKFDFIKNDLDGAAVYFDRLQTTDDSSIALFKDNTVQKSWMAFRDLSLSGSIDFTNHDKMGLETFFYRCNVDTLSFKKCSVNSTFWQMIDCQIANNIKFDEVTFKCDGELTFPDRTDHLKGEERKALPSHGKIADTIDHGGIARGFAFSGVKVAGTLSFIDSCDFVGPASFVGSVFDCPVSLQNTIFKDGVPDWRLTKFNAHFSIDGMEVDLSDKNDTAIDRKTYRDLSDRYRRLKELAITAKDHDRELDFFAEEMRTKRLGEENGWKRRANWIYDKVSDYGQSIAKPLYWLLGVLVCSAVALSLLSFFYTVLSLYERAEYAVKLSLQNILPFLHVSKVNYKDAYEGLFGEGVHLWIDLFLAFEGLLGFALIFLIGLALRNRFRL